METGLRGSAGDTRSARPPQAPAPRDPAAAREPRRRPWCPPWGPRGRAGRPGRPRRFTDEKTEAVEGTKLAQGHGEARTRDLTWGSPEWAPRVPGRAERVASGS
jgi:hypothetical protein